MGEGSRKGQREKLNCDVVAIKAPADPTGSSGMWIIAQSCPESRQESWALGILRGFGLLSGRRLNSEMATSFLPKAIPGDAAVTSIANSQDNWRNLYSGRGSR